MDILAVLAISSQFYRMVDKYIFLSCEPKDRIQLNAESMHITEL